MQNEKSYEKIEKDLNTYYSSNSSNNIWRNKFLIELLEDLNINTEMENVILIS